MLGKDRDIFLIDTKTGTVYNGGSDVGIDEIEKLINHKMPKATVNEKAKRFIIISGIELGVLKKVGAKSYDRAYNPNIKTWKHNTWIP